MTGMEFIEMFYPNSYGSQDIKKLKDLDDIIRGNDQINSTARKILIEEYGNNREDHRLISDWNKLYINCLEIALSYIEIDDKGVLEVNDS